MNYPSDSWLESFFIFSAIKHASYNRRFCLDSIFKTIVLIIGSVK